MLRDVSSHVLSLGLNVGHPQCLSRKLRWGEILQQVQIKQSAVQDGSAEVGMEEGENSGFKNHQEPSALEQKVALSCFYCCMTPPLSSRDKKNLHCKNQHPTTARRPDQPLLGSASQVEGRFSTVLYAHYDTQGKNISKQPSSQYPKLFPKPGLR